VPGINKFVLNSKKIFCIKNLEGAGAGAYNKESESVLKHWVKVAGEAELIGASQRLFIIKDYLRRYI